MKVGDRVTVDAIMNQSECRWVVLTDLVYSSLGGVDGGVIKFICDTQTQAGGLAAPLDLSGVPTCLVCGSVEELNVGGVFVE